MTEARLARGQATLACLKDLAPALRTGRPVVVAGDFNEPSHLDWTEAAARAGVHPIPVTWPATRSFAEAGLADAWRTVHPDPIERPGLTWTPRPSAREVHDRIDIVLFGGPGVTVVDAVLVGEKDPPAGLVVTPYPSDHRAVRVRLSIRTQS